METTQDLTVRFRITRARATLLLAFLFIIWHPGFIGSETLTLTTYYPAPYGGYVSLLTTNKTILARDAGLVLVGTGTQPSANPKLFVSGDVVSTLGAYGQFRAIAGSYGAFIRNDGADTYMPLITAAGDPYGVWNGLRPLRVNDASGDVYLANSQIVATHSNGNLSVGGSETVGGNLTVNGNMSLTGQFTSMLTFSGASGGISGLCQRVGYSYPNGNQACSAGYVITGFYGNGVGQVGGFLPASVTSSGVGTYIVIGEDWNGTMVCCKLNF
jgi:hypothetical protein